MTNESGWLLPLCCALLFLPLSTHAGGEEIQEWQDLRFGMFIHWGPVALKGTEIGWSRGRQVPIEEYDNLYKAFNPVRFNAREWVLTAKQAGMKYLVITSKHHDGFCLWDTQETDYNIMHTPFGRDVVKELAQACREQDLAFGVYYSVLDWYHPDYGTGSPGGKIVKPDPHMDRYQRYMHNQLKELSDHYGPLLTLWFDGEWEKPWNCERGERLFAFCRQLDSRILINNRVGKARSGEGGTQAQSAANPGHYDTPEQRIGAFNNQRPWETCMTICRQWAWKPDDQLKSFKECIQTLARTAGGDGNLLFNVGPMPDGRIEPRQVVRLREMGAWLEKNGPSIYGTRGGPFYPGTWGCSTHAGNRIFVHVFQWLEEKRLLPGLENTIRSATRLNGDPVTFEQTDKQITLRLPDKGQDPVDTVIVLEMAEPVTEMAKIKWAPTLFDTGNFGTWISGQATYEMSSRVEKWSTNEACLLKGEEYGNGYAFHTAKTRNPYIIIDLMDPAQVKGLHIINRQDGLEERAQSLTVWLSADRQNWTRVWQADSVQKEWLIIPEPATKECKSRYVKIGLCEEEPTYLHLHTVKIFGVR